MSTEIMEPDAGGCGGPDRCPGRGGNDDLASVGCRADASGGVNGQADVPGVRQCRTAAMDADTDPDLQIVGPGPVAELALDRHRCFDSGRGPLEHGKELVGPSVDLAAARSRHGWPPAP